MARLSLLVLVGLFLSFATPQIAYAHSGIGPGQNPWTAWNLTPGVTLGTVLAGYLYVRGLRRWPRPHHPVAGWQRASFFLGLAAIWLALQSPIDPLAEHLFSIHQVQHLLLRMAGPVLLFVGAPLTPFLRGMPRWARQGLVRPVVREPLVRAAYTFLTKPVIASLLFLGVAYFWHFPFAHNAALHSDSVHYAMHVAMLSTGLLFWWLIIDPKPHRSRIPYGLRALLLFVTMIPNTILGAIITFSLTPLYEAYGEVERVGALSLLEDQQIGGVILWIPGDMMHLLAAAYLFFAWFREENRR